MGFCECGKKMAQWRTKCKSCSEKEMAEWKERRLKLIDKINTALEKGVQVRTQVQGRPVTVKYLYEGVPGTWFVDCNGSHWCMSSLKEFEDQINP